MLRKNVKSFEQWCKENGKESYLELWDYDKNPITPSEVAASNSLDKFYFKCSKCKHESFLKGINNLIHSKDLVCPQCNSFYEWCVEHDRNDLINAWDNTANIDIHFAQKASGNKYHFIINNNCDYLFSLCEITCKNHDPIKKYLNSFGYYLISRYGEDALDIYWSDKNTSSPYSFDRGSAKKVWIKCTEKSYHDDYETFCYAFTGKQQCRCPACASKIIYPQDSFASFNTERYGVKWKEECWCDDNSVDPYKITVYDNDTKIHVKCRKVDYHDYWTTPSRYDARDNVCPYCKRKLLHKFDSFGYKHKDIIHLWSSKNIVDPYSVSEFCHDKYWFKCENCIHQDYERSLSDCFRDNNFLFRCPECAKLDTISSFQKAINDYFAMSGYQVLHEYNCNIIPINPKTNYPLPLDNEITDVKLIIEVNGEQHYKINGFHIMAAKHNNTTPEAELEYTQWKDEFKKNYVLSHGYHYLAIPYTAFSSNEYINMIENKIAEIQSA